jgi:hypothetical protein
MRYFSELHPKLHPVRIKSVGGAALMDSLLHWEVARTAGLEPTTYGLEDRCSIH